MRRAVGALERREFAAAEPLFRKLNARWPEFPDAWHFHGLLCHQRGESAQALGLLEQAEQLAPEQFSFLVNFARVLMEIGQPEKALERLLKAHALQPGDARIVTAIAQLYLRAGRGGLYAGELERFLERTPQDWRLRVLLAQCREQGGAREAAIAAFEEAIAHAPRSETTPLILLAESARRDSQPELARKALQRALERDPNVAGAWLGLGHLEQQRGEFAEAKTHFRAALARDPGLNAAWEALSLMASGAESEPLLHELDTAIAAADGRGDDWLLNFSRARLRERLGDYDGAFADYVAGNRPRTPTDRYVREIHEAYARDVMTHLGRDFMARRIATPTGTPRPIFICGMFRSGTTLVETILGSHPEVTAGGEMHYIHDRTLREVGKSGLNRSGSWLGAQSDAQLEAMARDWQAALGEAAGGQARITDKMPGNYTLLGLIDLCFPDAPIVHVHRDARDNCLSCFATPFQENYLPSATLESMGHTYRLYECFMNHWRTALDPRRIIEIEYEALVADPEGEIRRLLEAVGLPWDARCLDFHKSRHEVRTASVFQVRQPLYSSSIGRWRHFESHLAPLLAELQGPSPL